MPYAGRWQRQARSGLWTPRPRVWTPPRRVPAPHPIQAAAAIVQHTSAEFGSATSISLAFGSNVTAGNAIIICCALFGTAAFPVSGASDTRGTTYTRDVNLFVSGTSTGVAIYSAPNIPTSGACTVTIAGLASGTLGTMAIYEVSGLPTSGIFDKGATNNGASGTSHTTGTTGTAAQATGIVFAVDAHDGTGVSTPTVASPFTIGEIQTGTTNQPIATATRITTSAATQQATFTWENTTWAACIGIYKDVAAATDHVPFPVLIVTPAVPQHMEV